MKKVLFSLGLLLATPYAFAGNLSAKSTILEYDNSECFMTSGSLDTVGPIITISVELGRASKNCKGYGICRFVNADVDRGLTLKLEEGNYNRNEQLVFRYDEIFRNKVIEHFGQPVIIVQEPFTLPQEVTQILEINNFIIPVGTYPLNNGRIVFNNGF